MPVQYVIDEQGRRTAVQIPIEEWEALRVRNLEFADDVPAEEIARAKGAMAEIRADPGKAEPIETVMRELLDDAGR
jgi:hypothetical protein